MGEVVSNLNPETVAALVAAVSAILVYFSDRLTQFWRRITARSRWVDVLLRNHPPSGSVIRSLRGTEDHYMGYYGLPPYAGAVVFFSIPSVIPGVSQFNFDLLLLYGYSIAVLSVIHGFLAQRVPALLASADTSSDIVPKAARWRYHLARDFSVAWAPGILGAVVGQFVNSHLGVNLETEGTLFSLALLVYFSYLIYTQWWTGSRSDEQTAYQRWIVARNRAPQIEVWLERRAHKEAQQVCGTLIGIEGAMRIQRTDSFVEELEWHEIRRIALKL